jgi:hypothetical protein
MVMFERDSTPAVSGREHLLRLRASFEALHERAPALRNLDATTLEDEVYHDLMELLRLGSRRQKEALLDYTTSEPRLLEQIMSLPRS